MIKECAYLYCNHQPKVSKSDLWIFALGLFPFLGVSVGDSLGKHFKVQLYKFQLIFQLKF